MSKINETARNAPAVRDPTDAELDGVNGGSMFSVVQDILADHHRAQFTGALTDSEYADWAVDIRCH
jgi:hypothetical protein